MGLICALCQDRKIIELGSGSGLAGLAFAACGGDVLLTDLPKCMVLLQLQGRSSSMHAFVRQPSELPCVQDLLKQNIAQNEALIAAAGGHAQCCPFIWGTSTLLDLPHAWQQADLVIAADVRARTGARPQGSSHPLRSDTCWPCRSSTTKSS